MPVAGGRAQKRVNERATNHNLDPGSLQHHRDALQEVAGWHMEDWEELEALLETEHLILGQQFQPQQQHRSDVNLLQSPERTPRLPPEVPPSRGSSRRTLPRTHGAYSVPLQQLSSILLNMTFSDAEDDHQGTGRNTSNDQDRSLSRSRTESGVSNASTASLASPSSSAGPATAATANGPTAASGSAGGGLDLAAAQSASVADVTGVDKKKIVEKLQQIQGYIQQTTAAMAALEQQGDIGLQSDIYARYVNLNKSLQQQEEEYLDILARSLVLNKLQPLTQAVAQVANGTQQQTTAPISSSPATAQVNGREETAPEEGSRVVGVIGSENVRTLQDRLSASQEESVAIMSQMRASIARREDLLTRYKATQERLANLKKQRQGIQEEKQRLLQQGASTGGTSQEDEDPIPGADTWTLSEVTRAMVDFQALQDKVERLTAVYTTRAQGVDPDDAEAQADVASKLGQLASKRRQLAEVLTRLRGYQALRQQEERDGLEGEGGGGRSTSTVPAGASDTNNVPASSNAHTTTTTSDETATPAPLPPPPPSSSLSPSVSNINGEGGAVSPASLREAASSVSQASEELQSRRAQLNSLQKQLSDMKKLLDVANKARQEFGDDGAHALPTASTGPEVPTEILEVSGKRIVLTEAERQNPEIAAKYSELSRAKDRLAKMEEVITMIGQARQSGQNLREVIPADYLAILEEAEDEFAAESGRPAPHSRSSAPHLRSLEVEEEVGRSSRRPTRPPRMGSMGRSEAGAGTGLGRDSQESREISAMQQRLNKTSTRVSAINEGSRHGHEKGAIKKQPQWQGSNSGTGGSSGGGAREDPRLAQVLAMQEELRQKKNALEALMRRMGKSSSLNMDNISDNISDNVSETSDRLGDVRGSGGAATWGEAGGLHHFSDNHYQQSSDEDLIDEDEADLPPRGSQLRPQQPPPIAVSPKDRNRHSASRHRRRQDSGRLSVNNLATATLPTPTRTKHNRLRASSAPKALWESVGALESTSYKSPSNTTMQTQHSLNAALNQLTQVQGTINNLQESLRHEQSQVLGSSRATLYQPQLVPSFLPDITPTSLPPVAPPSQALTPMSAYAGLGSLALAAQGGGETVNQQLLAGLQQCFSQLHLHSLEIQALSKHLQLLERRDQTGSAAMADVGDGLCRGGRSGARRSEEEEEDEDNEDDDVPGGSRPPYPLHHNLLAASGLRPGKEGGASRAPQGSSYPVYMRQQGEGGGAPSSGVTNPIYGHLGDLRDQTGGTWGSLAPTPGTEQPTDSLGSLLGPGAPGEALEGSPSHPLLHLGRLGEEGGQTQAPEAHHWASLASTHPLHHQTTDLLNNQVPPGTRANNYWDNFRSYSRQNLLSTATKSNTSDLHPPSSASTTAPSHSASFALHQGREAGRGEDKRFNVSLGHNNTNSGAGARSRMPNPHINNPRGAANPRVRNPVTASSQHLLSQNKHKANNRNKQGDLLTSSKGSERNLPPQDRGSGGRNLGYINYNSVRVNTSDNDGTAEGSGVTLEVLREAEALIRRHANQPEFLLQLFRHASQITVHTDQHVAVALLHDLASQPHRPAIHGVNANPGPDVRIHTEGSGSLSLPAPLRDSWRPQPPRSHPQNTLPQENVSVVGLSGSEVSDSGLTSEDEDSRALYRNVKNLSLSPGGATQPPAPPGGVNTGARPQYPQPPPLHPHYHHNYHDYAPHRHHNLSNPPTTQGGESARSVANSEGSLYDHLVFNDSHMATRQEVVEDWVRRGVEEEEEEEEVGPSKLLNQTDTAGSSPEDAHNLIHPLNNDTEYLTFETLVASAVREGTEVLQAQACEDVASPLLLNSLHHSLVAHIQTRAQSLRLPQSFLYSTDTELKSALQAFTGKPLSQVSVDVPSIISQVLLTQYCSVLVQRLRDNQPLLPQTPTKLPSTPHPKAGEMGLEGAAATPTAAPPECRPPQEATTATQTEAGVFSLHPQRPPLHTSHTFSLTTGAAAAHPPPPGPLSAATPAESPWQAPPPPPAPLPSPNHNPGVAESLAESAACSGVPLPAAQSGSWSAEGLASPASPLGAARGEAEQEEAMMDELGEPTLVHTLAEADQSQDAVEGDWGEDSQAEGIMQAEASGGAAGGASHPHPQPQHSGWLPARDTTSQLEAEAEVEGLVESEAEAAALGAGHLIFMDQQSQELDEVPTKLQSPQGGSPSDSPEQALPQHHHQHHPHHHQRPHSPAGSEG